MLQPSEIACLIPTLFRPAGLTRVLKSLKETAPEVHCVVARDPDDTEAFVIASLFGAQIVTMPEKRMGCHPPWNAALRAAPDYQAYILGADDFYFTPGWLEETLRVLETELHGSGLVGFNDMRKNALKHCTTHFLVTRDFIIDYQGGVMAFECYQCDYTDLESDRRARRAGKWAWAQNARVPHDWRGKVDLDDIAYKLARPKRDAQEAIYKAREAAGFPDDQEPILKD
jgi:hypothetical protein